MIRNFSEEELEIINEYLNQDLSVREIEKKHKGFGRTKIKNILDAYASKGKENTELIECKRLSKKYHKEITCIDDVNSEELTDSQIQNAYYKIMQGEETLTSIARELNKNRETVKNAITEYLADKDSLKEFNKVLKYNQNKVKEKHQFFSLSEKQKKEEIFRRLNYRRKIRGRNEYSIELLNRKFDRLSNYFQKRNSRIQNNADQINDEDLLKMLYDYPTLLSMSLSNKIKPIVNQLDYKYLDYSRTSRLLRENPSILGTSLERTAIQMRILKKSNTLEYAIEKPRIFRTSPKLMYALIELWKDKKETQTPFITNKKVYEIYSRTPNELEKIYDVKSEYGDDEYFDRR